MRRCLMRRWRVYRAYKLVPHPAIVRGCLMRPGTSYHAYKPAPER